MAVAALLQEVIIPRVHITYKACLGIALKMNVHCGKVGFLKAILGRWNKDSFASLNYWLRRVTETTCQHG